MGKLIYCYSFTDDESAVYKLLDNYERNKITVDEIICMRKKCEENNNDGDQSDDTTQDVPQESQMEGVFRRSTRSSKPNLDPAFLYKKSCDDQQKDLNATAIKKSTTAKQQLHKKAESLSVLDQIKLSRSKVKLLLCFLLQLLDFYSVIFFR